LAISGWGGGTQLPGTLRGLNRVLPTNIVFTCLGPDQGWSPQPPVLAEIAKHREVWAVPWLEGDARLWHLQPHVSLLREHVQLASEQQLHGVIAIHWRTEETRANLEAFARFAGNPATAPTVEEFYLRDCEEQFGKAGRRRIGWQAVATGPQAGYVHPIARILPLRPELGPTETGPSRSPQQRRGAPRPAHYARPRPAPAAQLGLADRQFRVHAAAR
jgi:hypothetical protein